MSLEDVGDELLCSWLFVLFVRRERCWWVVTQPVIFLSAAAGGQWRGQQQQSRPGLACHCNTGQTPGHCNTSLHHITPPGPGIRDLLTSSQHSQDSSSHHSDYPSWPPSPVTTHLEFDQQTPTDTTARAPIQKELMNGMFPVNNIIKLPYSLLYYQYQNI